MAQAICLLKDFSLAFGKRKQFPLVTWAHGALQSGCGFWYPPTYIYISQSQKWCHQPVACQVPDSTEVHAAISGHFTNIALRWRHNMGAMASQITSLAIVYSTVYSGADQRKHQSSALLVFVWGIHRWPMNSPHKWPEMWKMFPFDDVIMD